MNTPEPSSQQKSPQKAESGTDALTDPAMIDFASVLDEEVVDQEGAPIGTLACFWKSVSGLVIFLGIKVKGQQSVRIVPGRRSQVDDRNTCIRLGFEAEAIASAPRFDCADELDATFRAA